MEEVKFPTSLFEKGRIGHLAYFLLMFAIGLVALVILNMITESWLGSSVSTVGILTLALIVAVMNTMTTSRLYKKLKEKRARDVF